MTKLDSIYQDLKIKVVATLCLIVFSSLCVLFSPKSTSNLLAGSVVFGSLFIIFVIGICSDYKAMKYYRKKDFTNRKRD